jgi:hypothetical protein
MDGLGSIAGRDKIFLLPIVSRLVLGLNQPPIQQVPGAISQGVKRPGREAHYSLISSTEVKNDGALPPRCHMFHGIALI